MNSLGWWRKNANKASTVLNPEILSVGVIYTIHDLWWEGDDKAIKTPSLEASTTIGIH